MLDCGTPLPGGGGLDLSARRCQVNYGCIGTPALNFLGPFGLVKQCIVADVAALFGVYCSLALTVVAAPVAVFGC